MFKSLALAALVMIFLPFKASEAMVFIEPLVGYNTGTYNADLVISGDRVQMDTSISGLTYGARGGLSTHGLQLGLEYIKNDFKVKEEEDFGTDKLETQETSLFLGYQFYFLRIYAGYIFNAKIKDGDFDPGKGFKAGLSFYILKNLALSIESRSVDFDEYKNDDSDIIDGKYRTAAILLSVPLEI